MFSVCCDCCDIAAAPQAAKRIRKLLWILLKTQSEDKSKSPGIERKRGSSSRVDGGRQLPVLSLPSTSTDQGLSLLVTRSTYLPIPAYTCLYLPIPAYTCLPNCFLLSRSCVSPQRQKNCSAWFDRQKITSNSDAQHPSGELNMKYSIHI